MGVGYLTRIARRGLPTAAPARPAKPAQASRSPVAELDQRLNLDDFTTALSAAPSELAADTPDRPVIAVANLAMPPASESVTRARRERRDEAPPAPRSRPALPGVGGPSVALRPADPPPSDRQVPRALPQATSARPRPAAPAARSEPRATAPDAAKPRVSAPAKPAVADPEPPVSTAVTRAPRPRKTAGPSADRVTESDELGRQLAALQRWLEGSQAAPTPASRPSPVTTPSANVSVPAMPAVAAAPARDVEPAPRLEIGHIEVEVVAPAKAPAAQQPRPSQRPQRPTASTRAARPFGWRQR